MSRHPIEDLIVGVSPAIVALRERVLQLAPLGINVMIEGPTGTGKELVARALHQFSGRKGRLVATNVCAVNESVFENEFFGHKKGGYTGALSDAPGLLVEADGGTLFLDEISGLSLAMQAKLLRAVETGEFRPVGARADARSGFRTVSATNVPVERLVRVGQLRSDLRHRLAGVVVRTVALAERREDIPVLVEHLSFERCGARGRFSAAAMSYLERLDWGGNVRELRQFVDLAVELHPGVVSFPVARGLLADAMGEMPVPSIAMDTAHVRLQRMLIEHRGSKPDVARAMGVHLATVYRQIKRAGLSSTFTG